MPFSVDEYLLSPDLVAEWKAELSSFLGNNPGKSWDTIDFTRNVLKINWNNPSEILNHSTDQWAIHTALNQLAADGAVAITSGRGSDVTITSKLPKV